MKRRCITVLVGFGLCIGAQAFGQSISPAIKTSGRIAEAEQNTIKQFVQGNIAKIGSDSPAQQTEGRDALANIVFGEPAASAAFVDAYTLTLNDALVSLTAHKDYRVRLNAAVVAAKVTSRTGSSRLKPVVLKLINDPADPVVLWAAKAHGTMILSLLKSNPKAADDPLIKGLAAAVKDNLSGPVTQEVYESLRLNIVNERKAITADMVKAVVPAMQDVLAARVAQYQRGIPDMPAVDTLATGFLVDISVWPQQTPEQRVRTGQLIADLLSMSAARAASLDSDRSRKDEVVQTIKLVARAVQVIGDSAAKPNLGAVAGPLAKLDVSMSGEQIQKLCSDVVTQMVSDIPGVKQSNVSVAPTTTGQANP